MYLDHSNFLFHVVLIVLRILEIDLDVSFWYPLTLDQLKTRFMRAGVIRKVSIFTPECKHECFVVILSIQRIHLHSTLQWWKCYRTSTLFFLMWLSTLYLLILLLPIVKLSSMILWFTHSMFLPYFTILLVYLKTLQNTGYRLRLLNLIFPAPNEVYWVWLDY